VSKNGHKIMAWSSGINRAAMEEICFFLLACKKEEKDAILLLSSDGGEMDALTAILDTLIASKVHLTVIGRGMVASAAATLFCMGDERILLPNSRLLLHCVRSFSSAPNKMFAEDAERLYNEMHAFNEYTIRMLCAKTKLTPEVYEARCEKREDWILTAEDVEKYGVVTSPYSDDWVDLVVGAMVDKPK